MTSFIPSPEMMQGDFSDQTTLTTQRSAPHGFFQGRTSERLRRRRLVQLIAGGAVLANGATYSNELATPLPTPAATGTYTSGSTTYNVDGGQKFPSGFLDPGALAALAKIWPKANITPSANVCNGCNSDKPIVNVDNGWIPIAYARTTLLGDNTKIYGSYETGIQLRASRRAMARTSTGRPAIPSPSRVAATWRITTAQSWPAISCAQLQCHNHQRLPGGLGTFGSYPFTSPDPSAAFRTTLGYPSNATARCFPRRLPVFPVTTAAETFQISRRPRSSRILWVDMR